MKTALLLLSAGSGSRMGLGRNKVFSRWRESVLRRSLEAFAGLADEAIIVCRPEEEEEAAREAGQALFPAPVRFAPGGDTRQDSVARGFQSSGCLPGDLVLIHDCARCLVSPR